MDKTKNQKHNLENQVELARLKTLQEHRPAQYAVLIEWIDTVHHIWTRLEYAVAILAALLSYRIAPWAPLVVGVGFIGLLNRRHFNLAKLRFLSIASAASVVALKIVVVVPGPAAALLFVAVAAVLTTLISTALYLLRMSALRHEQG